MESGMQRPWSLRRAHQSWSRREAWKAPRHSQSLTVMVAPCARSHATSQKTRQARATTFSQRATVVPLVARALRFAAASSQSLSQAPPPRFWRPTALPGIRHDASVRAPRSSKSLKQPTAQSRARMSCIIVVHDLLFPLISPSTRSRRLVCQFIARPLARPSRPTILTLTPRDKRHGWFCLIAAAPAVRDLVSIVFSATCIYVEGQGAVAGCLS